MDLMQPDVRQKIWVVTIIADIALEQNKYHGEMIDPAH